MFPINGIPVLVIECGSEAFIRQLKLFAAIAVVMVNESGAFRAVEAEASALSGPPPQSGGSAIGTGLGNPFGGNDWFSQATRKK